MSSGLVRGEGRQKRERHMEGKQNKGKTRMKKVRKGGFKRDGKRKEMDGHRSGLVHNDHGDG